MLAQHKCARSLTTAQHTPPAQRSAKNKAPIISDVLAHTGGGLPRASVRRQATPLSFTPLFYSLESVRVKKRFFKAILYIPGPVGTSIT